MKINLLTVSTASALLMSGFTTVQASDDQEGWYFSPMLSYIKADSERQADDDFGVMIGVGKQLNKDWNLEVSAVFDNLELESGMGEYEQLGLVVDGLYFFDREASLQTYGIVGAGVMSTEVGTSDSTNPMLNVGLGVMKQISDGGMKFRAEVRYRLDMDDQSVASEDDFGDVMLNLGLTIPFGDKQQVASKTKTSVNDDMYKDNSSKDADNDGVVDSTDKCPGTLAGVKVNDNGCSQVDATEKPVVAVESKVADTDKDGVLDANDKCPATTAGSIVDTKGCELKKSFVLKGVNFVTGSDQLTNESKTILNDVAIVLLKNNEMVIELAGYTDNRGNPKLNDKLSKMRAESVMNYLVTKGVNSQRMSAIGLGDENPISSNDTSDGRANNRRVELKILD